MTGADAVLRAAAAELHAAGVPDAMRDARRLLDHAAGRALRHDDVPEDVRAVFEALVARRRAREPVSHLIGRRAFWHHDFEVCADVLDPRPETECLVEEALSGTFASVLDLGTGSGAILLSLLAERGTSARGVGTDLSPAALAVARRNAVNLGVQAQVQFLLSDWFDAVDGRFDLIVSNPPYIAATEMPGLAPELGFEPRLALTDEGDGLSAYRAIAADAGAHLVAGGRLIVEIGHRQGPQVAALFEAAGLTDIAIKTDLDGRDRVVLGHAPG